MSYEPLFTLAAKFTNSDIGLVLLALGCMGIGIFFLLTPAQHLLRSDQKTARVIYERELKATGDSNQAIASAAFFYRLFGGIFVLFGLVVFAFACIQS